MCIAGAIDDGSIWVAEDDAAGFSAGSMIAQLATMLQRHMCSGGTRSGPGQTVKAP
jgi:hypothetical protein